MIVLDTTSLSFLFIPGYTPSTPVKYGKERMEELRETITANHDKLGIPSPALSELLVACNEKQTDEFLKMLRTAAWLEVLDFDTAAAVEVAIRTRKAIEAGDKREGMSVDGAKIKFDRQIVGTAIAAHATKIISDDKHVKNLGERWGIEVIRVADLPLPASLIPPPLLKAAIEAEEAEEINKPTPQSGPAKEQPTKSAGTGNGS
jgi:predicted nucleic acid-binding protein